MEIVADHDRLQSRGERIERVADERRDDHRLDVEFLDHLPEDAAGTRGSWSLVDRMARAMSQVRTGIIAAGSE